MSMENYESGIKRHQRVGLAHRLAEFRTYERPTGTSLIGPHDYRHAITALVVARVERHLSRGSAPEYAAKRLGITAYVAGVIRERVASAPPPKGTQVEWSSADTATARRMLRQGATRAAIGRAVGRTASAVTQWWHRQKGTGA